MNESKDIVDDTDADEAEEAAMRAAPNQIDADRAVDIEKLIADPAGAQFKSVPANPKNVQFSSASVEWATPQDFFDRMHAEFNFALDVCATRENAKCGRFYTAEVDGLKQRWNVGPHEAVWMNPPYGREIVHWVRKAWRTAYSGEGTVVCLVPSRTDTLWWHEFIQPFAEVRFVRGRLKFGGQKNPAPFPSAVAIFRRQSV